MASDSKGNSLHKTKEERWNQALKVSQVLLKNSLWGIHTLGTSCSLPLDGEGGQKVWGLVQPMTHCGFLQKQPPFSEPEFPQL